MTQGIPPSPVPAPRGLEKEEPEFVPYEADIPTNDGNREVRNDADPPRETERQ